MLITYLMGLILLITSSPAPVISQNICSHPDVICEPHHIIQNATITAYSEYDSCHTGKSCLMASGKKAYIGAIACPRSLGFNTRVVIDNTPYICEDRTSIKYDGRFDIFMGYGEDSYQKALNYGIKEKKVKIYRSSL